MGFADDRPLDDPALPDLQTVHPCPGWKKYAKTAALFYSWISLGLYSEILGPTLPTLMHQTGSNYEQIGLALSVRSVGLLSGSLVGGFVSDKWTRLRALMMSASLIVAALTNFIIPVTRTLGGLATILYVAGCSHGFLTTHGNPLLGSVWGSKASGPFSLMHSGYGLGAALAPILVAPFTLHSSPAGHENVTQPVPQSHSSAEADPPLPVLPNNSTDSALINPTIPYSLVGIVALLCACCFLPFSDLNCVRDCFRNRGHQQLQQTVSERTDASGIPLSWSQRLSHTCRSMCQHVTRREIFLVFCTFIIYFAVVGNERVFGKFMFTYAIYGPVHMTTHTGYILHLVYWFFFGMARLLTFGLAFLIPARMMLSLLAVGTLAVSVGLIFIPTTPSWFFAFTCLFSLFKSPLFPGTLAAINLSHEITGFLVLIVNLGSACGASLLQYAAGSLIQSYGQTVFPYLVCGSACVVLLTATALIFNLRLMGTRFTPTIEAEFEQKRREKVDSVASRDEGLDAQFVQERSAIKGEECNRV